MEEINQKVCARIKSARLSKNKSQSDLAKALHLTTTAYNRIENNKTQLTITMLFQIAHFLELTISDLLELRHLCQSKEINTAIDINQDQNILHLSINLKELKVV